MPSKRSFWLGETNPMVVFVSHSSTPVAVCLGWEKHTLAPGVYSFPPPHSDFAATVGS